MTDTTEVEVVAVTVEAMVAVTTVVTTTRTSPVDPLPHLPAPLLRLPQVVPMQPAWPTTAPNTPSTTVPLTPTPPTLILTLLMVDTRTMSHTIITTRPPPLSSNSRQRPVLPLPLRLARLLLPHLLALDPLLRLLLAEAATLRYELPWI